MNNLGKENWLEMKWILKYLRGTTKNALCFGQLDAILQGYVNYNMVGDKDGRRSTTRYVFTLFKVAKGHCTLTIEAKYVAMIEASKEMIWLRL